MALRFEHPPFPEEHSTDLKERFMNDVFSLLSSTEELKISWTISFSSSLGYD